MTPTRPALHIIGPFRGPTGYDRHTREFTRQLVRLGCPVQLTSLDHWSAPLPENQRDPWFETLSAPVNAGTALHFAMPNHCAPRPELRNVNFTMFEAARIPADWALCARAHHRIVVPTQACVEAWCAAGVPAQQMSLCPLGVDGAYFSQPAPPLHSLTAGGRPVASYRYRFLNVAELRPRKNLYGLLRTWIRATRSHDDAVLILKCSVFQPRNLELFSADLAEMQRQLGRSLADAAPVLLLLDTLSDEQMRSLYRSATHYLSMSFGEGWDLPMMEAAAAGLQLIAPAHSSYLTYLTDRDATLIPASQVPAVIETRAGSEDRLFFDGLEWWRPDEDAATAMLRDIVAGSAPSKPLPQARILQDYTWDHAGRCLLSILENL